jgi:hypothetical protein
VVELLDQILPLSRFSPEDRLRGLVLYLRARAGANETTFRRATTDLGIPGPVATALLHGDIPAARDALKGLAHDLGAPWPVIASWLGYGGGLAAEYAAMVAFHNEWEEIDTYPAARRPLPVSRTMLAQRGYQSTLESFRADPTEAATDPRGVTTPAELIEALECLRIRAGNPSLRDIAERSETVPEGADPTKHIPRSYNTVHKVLKGGSRAPHLVSVLAFARGCGVLDLEELAAWEAACTRIAIVSRRPPEPRAPGEEGWRAPSGPNPSMA